LKWAAAISVSFLPTKIGMNGACGLVVIRPTAKQRINAVQTLIKKKTLNIFKQILFIFVGYHPNDITTCRNGHSHSFTYAISSLIMHASFDKAKLHAADRRLTLTRSQRENSNIPMTLLPSSDCTQFL